MAKYIGITLGPIGDTIDLSSTPAGLWGASYLFSYIAHEIRNNLQGMGVKGLIFDDEIYDSASDSRLTGKSVGELFEKGIGLYHDRIIYACNDDEDEALKTAGTAVKDAVSMIVGGFEKSSLFNDPSSKIEIDKFFYGYFNIHIVCLEAGEDFLFKVNDALDAAELEKNFASQLDENIILSLFDNKKDEAKRNEAIKQSFLVTHDIAIGDKRNQPNKWILFDAKRDKIKDLPYISSGKPHSAYEEGEKAKPYYYFAVIRADGDNMGQTIKETIKDEASYQAFSKACIKYGCKTANKVLEYGGIPIYVGGDDLLCIVPLMEIVNGQTKTFMDLIAEIRQIFITEDCFKNGPDLSFGVQIQYYKAPLYEALDKSYSLLGTAKGKKPGACAINIEKHSGQSAGILIEGFCDKEKGQDAFKKVNELICWKVNDHSSDGENQKANTSGKKEQLLHSVGSHIAEFEKFLNQAEKMGPEAVNNFFDNFFDSSFTDSQKKFLTNIKILATEMDHVYGIDQKKDLPIAKKSLATETDRVHDVDQNKELSVAEKLEACIRLIKFFSEKAERGEER